MTRETWGYVARDALRGAIIGGIIGVLAYLAIAPAHAMTPADVPAIPPNSVEVCEHHMQTVCPIVTGVSPMWVAAPNTIDNMPDLRGRIVRFEPVNSEMGAWVVLTRTGEQLWFPLREITLLAGAQ